MRMKDASSGASQEELAFKAGLNRAYVGYIERREKAKCGHFSLASKSSKNKTIRTP